jgi:hypothetical protein|tara:strand:- start:169 stop:348 length:180 start_codon:yes stop_codon:yes gene_type:complete
MITQEQYNQFVESMNEDDWTRVRIKMEEKIPEIIGWEDESFRSYATSIVRAGFRKAGLN